MNQAARLSAETLRLFVVDQLERLERIDRGGFILSEERVSQRVAGTLGELQSPYRLGIQACCLFLGTACILRYRRRPGRLDLAQRSQFRRFSRRLPGGAMFQRWVGAVTTLSAYYE